MLRYVYGTELGQFPRLQDSMFRDRAEQFARRLGWDVVVDEQGWERDSYDALNPLYVIWERPDGLHGGSLRLLPTVGRTMVNDHFSHLTDGVKITSPLIWECTRFCLNAQAESRIAAALMLGGGEMMQAFSLTHLLGVFDARMVRIYRAVGAVPEILGSAGQGREQISVGLWSNTPDARARVMRRAGISAELSQNWFDRSLGQPLEERLFA
jgi:acyl homoserine lactone synthase